MTLSTLLRAALGQAIDAHLVHRIDDPLRLVSVWRKGQTLVVAFGGTRGPISPASPDWWRNAMAWPWFFAGLLAMWGFEREVRSVSKELLLVIRNQRPDRLEICGWSQGGAHAVLFLATVLWRFRGEIVVTGFAPPRCLWGPSALILWLMTKVRRVAVRLIALSGDPVTGLPWAWLGYRHLVRLSVLDPGHDLDAARHDGELYLKKMEDAEWH